MKFEFTEKELGTLSACLAIMKWECLDMLGLPVQTDWRNGLASGKEDREDKLREFVGKIHELELKIDHLYLPQAKGMLCVSPFGQDQEEVSL